MAKICKRSSAKNDIISRKTWSIDLIYKFLKLKTTTLYFTRICWNYHQFVWEHVGCRTSAVLGMRPFWRKVPVFLPCNFNTWFPSCTDVAADLHEFRGTTWCFTDRHHPGRKTSLAEEWIPSKATNVEAEHVSFGEFQSSSSFPHRFYWNGSKLYTPTESKHSHTTCNEKFPLAEDGLCSWRWSSSPIFKYNWKYTKMGICI